ncbi:MAG: hypothetical protein ABFS12_03395 [Bacteroidota bacterium]
MAYYLILGVMFISVTCVNSQEIEWERVSGGISISYLQPNGDMGKYWNNSFGLGGELKYELSKRTYLATGIQFSSFSKNNIKKSVPNFYFISIPLEIKFIFLIANGLHLSTGGGIQSNTFMFLGPEAEKLDDNDTESEFGIFIALGIETISFNEHTLEFYSKYQTIFSSPEQIGILFIGMRFFFF